MQAADFLARFGLTVGQATDFIVSNLSNPTGLFSILRQAGVGSDMVAQIVQSRFSTITAVDVRNFFAAHQLDTSELDSAYLDFLRSSISRTSSGMSHDSLVGTAGADHIDGGAGNDTIDGLAGDDILIGDSGNDVLRGGWGSDYLEGGLGADRLEAGRHEFWEPARLVGNQWVPGRWIQDLSANILLGGGGDDTLIGGYGPDRLDGGDGADWLEGWEGADVLLGGAGADRLWGGSGADRLLGGDGDDTIDAGNDADNDTVEGGAGNDRIEIRNNDDADAGAGNDRIEITFTSASAAVARAGVVVAGEGADIIDFNSVRASHGVVVDLTESVQSRDVVGWSLASGHGLTSPAIYVRGFNLQNDQFHIDSFNSAFQTTTWGFLGSSAAEIGWNGVIRRNFSQIITDPSQPFLSAAANPRTIDEHGKGFFAIRGAAASADDVVSVAAFLDPYGNNHTYGNRLVHYFLINVGSADSALYLFRDDTGADNRVTPDELVPIARFVGLRTEDFSSADLMNVFV